jgi:hypothetical protein
LNKSNAEGCNREKIDHIKKIKKMRVKTEIKKKQGHIKILNLRFKLKKKLQQKEKEIKRMRNKLKKKT